MTTFLYSATASADGYIAGPGGDMTWLQPFMGAEPDPILEPIIPRITALLMGRTTFDGEDPNAGDPELEGAFEGQWTGPQILLTRRPVEQQTPGLTAVGDFSAAVSASRQAAGPGGVVNVLGADVAGQCLKAGVLDELIISTVPILLGGGTPALRGLEGSRALTLIRSAATSTGQTAHYRVPTQQR